MTRRRPQKGFTLIEMVIFIVIVGIGVAGILSVFRTSVASSADPLIRKQTIAIAESLLEEIMLKAYCDPDTVDASTNPPTCGANAVEGSRSQYDDVDDYNGYTSVGITDAQGTTVPSLSAYSVTPAVSVSTATVGGLTVKVITVSVTGPQGTYSLTGYRGNY